MYHTVNVNTALDLAQKYGVGDQFALEMLSRHNEQVQDPNDPEQLEVTLVSLGVPAEQVRDALNDASRLIRNEQRTLEGQRMLTHGGVPEFFVRVPGGLNLCAAARGSPTHPSYFEHIFEQVLRADEHSNTIFGN